LTWPEEAHAWYGSRPRGSRSIDLKSAVKELDMAERGIKVTVGRAGGRPKPAEILTGVFGLSQEEALAARALKIKSTNFEKRRRRRGGRRLKRGHDFIDKRTLL
jgi:hypothetical protein